MILQVQELMSMLGLGALPSLEALGLNWTELGTDGMVRGYIVLGLGLDLGSGS